LFFFLYIKPGKNLFFFLIKTKEKGGGGGVG